MEVCLGAQVEEKRKNGAISSNSNELMHGATTTTANLLWQGIKWAAFTTAVLFGGIFLVLLASKLAHGLL